MQLDTTLRSHFEVLYRRQKLFGRSAETARLYHYTFDYFRQFLGREACLSSLRDDTVRDLLEWIVTKGGRNGTGLGPRTANKVRDQLVALWSFLARKGLTTDDDGKVIWPDVPPWPEPERDPVGWSKAQLAALWEMCEQQSGFIAGVRASLWWLSLHSTIWDGLERPGAMPNKVRWNGDVLCNEKGTIEYVNVKAEHRKGKRKPNLIKVHADTSLLLEALREPSRDFVWEWPHRKEYLWSKYREMRRRARLPIDRYHSFNCLRRTGGSFAEAAGADATKLLKHSSRSVTVKYYLVPQIVPQVHPADVLFRPGTDDGPRAA